MAIQDTIRRESPPASPETFAEELRSAVGHLCEVRKPNNTLVFLGRVQNFNGKALSVFPAGGKEAPPVIFNDEFKLVLHIPGKPALVWRGQICGSSYAFWKLDHLSRCHFKENRMNFRQPVSLRANLLCINSIYPNSPHGESEYYSRLCKVVDVSLGGIQLRSQDPYHVNDHLLLTNLWLDPLQPQPFVFSLQVRWVERISGVESRYGCAFESMSIRDEDRLCAAILDLQREDIANH